MNSNNPNTYKHSFAAKFVPVDLLNHPKRFRSASMIIHVVFFIIAYSVIFVPTFYFIGFTAGAIVMSVAFINSWVFLVLMRTTGNLALCGDFFSINSLFVFLSLCAFSGGLYSPFLVWLMTIPPIAFLYMRSEQGTKWTIATTLGFLGLAIPSILGYEWPQQLTGIWHPIKLTFSVVVVLALFLLMVQSFFRGYKRLNKKLQLANSNLEQSNEELERFAYIASHDLKTPLRNVVSFLNLFRRRYEKQVDESGREYLEIASVNARRMHNLIEDILEYSRSNNRALKQEYLDCTNIVNEIKGLLLVEGQYPQGTITFGDLPVFTGDLTLFHQLFQNLIENGLKYNDKPNPKVEVNCLRLPDHLQFSFCDNGIGIDEEYQEKIFEMFRRLHNNEEYHGTGIGLAICKKIVSYYSGQIWIESVAGQGATFFLQIPVTNLGEITFKEMNEESRVEL